MTTEKNYMQWYFLLVVIVIYIIIFIFEPSKIFLALGEFIFIFKSILMTFLFVFILMSITNYFVKPKLLVRYMGKESGFKGWIIAIFAGIISTGPIYMWYPMLNELQKHGVRDGLIGVFLYNRAIKIPFLPMLILYFGLTYTIILTIIMIFSSVLQGLIIEKLMRIEK